MAKDNDNIKDLENKLWEAADKLRANSPLRLNEFAEPVLGLIFLKFADIRFTKAQKEIEKKNRKKRKGISIGRDKPITHYHYQEKGVLYIPEEASFSYLISLPEGANLGKKLNNAMKAIEMENNELSGILPKTYQQLDNHTIIALLKIFNSIPDDIKGDTFGQIYEYFLGKFALSDGRGGGEFFTPTSIVKLIVEIIEPYHGRVYDPACGSGGMFVQSHEFVKRHLENGAREKAAQKIAIYGQEKTEQTVRIAKMNLAIHGLSGDIRQGNTYYDDMHKSVGKFDFTMANPPFNMNGIDYERIKDNPRFPYGLPRADNGNYVWIQHFWSSLNESGRAGFVMANSASDAGHSEKEIRKKLIQNRVVDVIVSVGPNMFYNVTLPVTLWFFDNGKKKMNRKDKVLFIDARNIYKQIDRAHRKFTDGQIDKIAGIARSYREENGAKKYKDIKGLCKVATFEEVEKAGWSLNPGRYVGVEEKEDDDGDFRENLKELNDQLNLLNKEACKLEKKISHNVEELLK
ncbi:SAM-dependent DNA methyltransferase [Candidatus Parcubacteria bacterium]|nr:SAM-dependent DNA methyltransferase [Candidatus Parcubacteria bacterium]